MGRRKNVCLAILLLSAPAVGAAPRAVLPDNALPPRPAQAIAAPQEPSPILTVTLRYDLSERGPRELEHWAADAAKRGDYAAAARILHWGVKNGSDALYDLACYLARAGQIDAAFHWLQRAALESTVSADWAQRDPDLAALRQDPRWPALSEFLHAANDYWANSGYFSYALVKPADYAPGDRINLAIWLHGIGSDPSHVESEKFQALADELGIAVLGISGTRPRGRTAFEWLSDPEADARHIERVLAHVETAEGLVAGRIALFGFSQGAQVAVETAARDPRRYRGALAFSPGSRRGAQLDALAQPVSLRGQRYLITVGADEHASNIALSRLNAEQLRRMGAAIEAVTKEGQGHTLPEDYWERLPEQLAGLFGRAR